jgi:hypothetical protein
MLEDSQWISDHRKNVLGVLGTLSVTGLQKGSVSGDIPTG